MPFSIQSDELGFSRVTASGLVSGTDLLHLHSTLAGDAENSGKCLIDFTGADVSQLSGPIVAGLTQLPPRYRRLAIVAKSGPAYGLARAYQASSSPDRPIGVFTVLDTALVWLIKRSRPDTT